MNSLQLYEGADGKYTTLPFHLPEQVNGKFKIVREVKRKGSRLSVVSLRNALLMGLPRAAITLERDVIIHRLIESYADGTQAAMWMSTLPQELEQCTRQLERAHGHVLVGGLGVGLAVGILCLNPKVKTIVVVEKQKEVIELVQPWLPINKPIIVVKQALKQYLKENKDSSFDFAFYDLWCLTQEWVLSSYVWPLRRLSKGIVEQSNIECWNEDEMIGQVRFSGLNWCLLSFQNKFKIRGLPDLMSLPPKKFRDEYRKSNREVWPFTAWVHDKRPGEAEAHEKLEQFLTEIKDQPMWLKHWRRYENYGYGQYRVTANPAFKKRNKMNHEKREKVSNIGADASLLR